MRDSVRGIQRVIRSVTREEVKDALKKMKVVK